MVVCVVIQNTMSVHNTNKLDTIDTTAKHLTNEIINANDNNKFCENRDLSETITETTKQTTIMPSATNTTVTVLNSSTTMPSSTEQCSDSEEDFERTARNLGAHTWMINYDDVS